MSEYQYYEFQAIDRPLTEKQMQTLRSYSTRARITCTSFTNEYHWGNFKGDADTWMEKYFDIFFYYANWGTHVLKLRLPVRLLPLQMARDYCVHESACVSQKGDRLILSFISEDEYGEDWMEDDSCLSSLIPVRAELARGDLRALYMGWLQGVQNHEVADGEIEPAVPPGLGQLSASMECLAKFLRIGQDLFHVAAQASPELKGAQLSRKDVRSWVAGLPAREKDDLLTRFIVDDESTSVTELLHRFLEHRNQARQNLKTPSKRRTVGELLEAAEVRTKERKQAEARKSAEAGARHKRQATIARAKHLDQLASQQSRLWTKIDNLIATKQPNRYDQAISLLIDLRDLAEREGNNKQFRKKIEAIQDIHARKPSLMKRLSKAGLR